jgi:hypothetical protein
MSNRPITILKFGIVPFLTSAFLGCFLVLSNPIEAGTIARASLDTAIDASFPTVLFLVPVLFALRSFALGKPESGFAKAWPFCLVAWKSYIVIICILLGFTTGTAIVMNLGQQNKPHTNQPNPKTTSDVQTPPMPISQPSFRSLIKTPASTSKQQTAQQEAKPFLTHGEWVMSFLTLIYVLISYFGLRAIKQQALLAEASTKATLRQMEISISKERPRIKVEPQPLNLGGRNLDKVDYTIDCWCPTPAFIVDAKSEAWIDDGGITRIPKVPISSIPNQILKNTTIEDFAIITESVDAASIEQINTEKLIVSLRGYIMYRGVHLSEKERPYQTTFSYKWVPPVPEIAGFRGYWQKYGATEDNQET